MTEDKPQHYSEEILNFQRFLSLVILLKRIFIKKAISTKKYVGTCFIALFIG